MTRIKFRTIRKKSAYHIILYLFNVNYKLGFRWGHTPLDEAHAFGHSSVAEFLENWESTRDEDMGDSKDPEKDLAPRKLSSPSVQPLPIDKKILD